MRIKELAISRYGPLPEIGKIPLADFTLFFGRNEHGKTLIIDALLKMLFKKEARQLKSSFGGLLRVSEQPEGYMVLDKDGVEFKLGKNQSISLHYNPPISPEDFRNIFVTRDSDLSIKSEAAYYTDVTEKLTGLRTDEIKRIMRALQKMGRLTNPTPDGKLADNKDTDHVASKVARCRELINEISALDKELNESGFDMLEKEMAECKHKLSRLKIELEHLEAARKREQLEDAMAKVRKLEGFREKLEGFEGISAECSARWQSCESGKNRAMVRLEATKETLTQKEKRLACITEELQSHNSSFKILEEQKKKIDNVIKPALQNCSKFQQEITSSSHVEQACKWGIGASILLLALSIIGSFLKESPFYIAMVVLWILSGMICLWGYLLLKRKSSKFSAAMDSLFVDAASIHRGEKDIGSLAGNIEGWEEKCERLRLIIIEQDKAREVTKAEVESAQKLRQGIQEEILEIDEEIKKLKLETGVNSLSELQKRLHEKTGLLLEKSELEGALSSFFEEKAAGENALEAWHEDLSMKLKAIDAKIPYDAKRHEELGKNIEELEKKIGGAEARLHTGRKKLSNLEVRLVGTGITADGPITCRTVGELEAAAGRLRRFVKEIENDEVTAKETMKIFQSIEADEKSRVSDLFGSGQAASHYFKEITEGCYEEVDFDTEEGRIHVGLPDGRKMAVECLSGGTLDQLYFAIRLSLAEQYLKNEKGFFILDDPFVKSDHERLSVQMEILKRISGEGWQVLYFSAKKEVREALEKEIDAGMVKLIELEEHV